MKMKNLFKFFSMMVLILMGQSALAQSAVVNDFRWSSGELNSIVKPKGATYSQFEKQTRDGFVTINITCDQHDVKYEDRTDLSLLTRYYLHVGHIQANALVGGKFSWKAYQQGYKVLMSTLETETAIPGSYCYYTLGSQEEKRIDSDYSLGWKTFKQGSLQTVSEVAYQYRGGSNRKNADNGYGAATNAFSMEYQILPDAPAWKNNDLLITVDSTNIHWFVLADQVEVNDAFSGTLKFDVQVVRGGEKYLFWNEDSTAFYVLKKMDVAIKAQIMASNGEYDYYDEERYGAYLASEVSSKKFTAKVPEGEKCQIFFYNEDEWIRDVNGEGNNFVTYFVTVPVEHFVEYVCAYEGPMTYVEKGNSIINYQDSVRERRDYFYMKGEQGFDKITVKIGDAQATLQINGIGKELNRVPFIIDSEQKFKDLEHSSKNVVWDANWTDAKETQGVANVVRFQGDFIMFTERQYKIHFIGVPDSLFYEYGNAVGTDGNGTFTVEWSADGNKWYTLRTITGKRLPSKNQQFYDSIKLDQSAQWLRFDYTDAQNAAYVKNIKVTEYKRLYANPADSLITFPTVKRAPGQHLTEHATLAWANLAPELRYDAKDPFSVKSRIKVRLDQYNETFANNKFAVLESLDNAGEFYQRMKIASMDVTQPMATYVTINGKVIFDTEDMFAAFIDSAYNVKNDTVQYGDTVIFAIKDSLNTILTHDSLIVTYVMDGDTIVGDTLIGACVGAHKIAVTAARNSFVTEDWSDTLYIYVRESEKDTITFNFSSADEIAVHDTLTVSALDPDAEFVFWTKEADAIEQKGDTIIIGSKTFVSDSLMIYAKTSQTCEHFEHTDSIKIKVRGIVTPEFNQKYDWMDTLNVGVFGNDTLVDPFLVWNEKGNQTLNADSTINIAFVYNPNDVVVDTVANAWYMRRSCEDSLFIQVTVSGDSIKTVKDSIKFPVKEYTARIEWPGTVNDRGYYYIGDTMKVEDFRAYATNPERLDKDLTDLVIWTKEFVEEADGTVLEDGSVRLDSINSIVLGVCLDTLFVKDTCAYDTVMVYPAKVAYWRFPGTNPDSIMVVGDSILVQNILVEDSIHRNLDMYVRYDFDYVPFDFAHHSNEEGYSTQFDYVVLDKNGLDTTAVDTIISNIRGGLVLDTTFHDRLLIAPVYAADVILPKYEFIVGDTLFIDDIIVIDNDSNDVTRYSSLKLAYAKGEAHDVEGGIVFDKVGAKIQIKVIFKRNESMHQGMKYKEVKVDAIEIVSMEGMNASYNVFDQFDTKDIIFKDAKGRVMNDYVEATYQLSNANASIKGGIVTFEHVGDVKLTAIIGGEAFGELDTTLAILPYEKAQVKFDNDVFVVGDDVEMSRFSLETEDGKLIDKSYYKFVFDLSENDARFNPDSTAMTLDSLATEVAVAIVSADIKLAKEEKITVDAEKITVDRIVFPAKSDNDEDNYLVRQGLAVKDIVVYDENNRDVTRYADAEYISFHSNKKIIVTDALDSIYFEQEGFHTITTKMGKVLMNEIKNLKNKIYVEQMQVDSIALPEREFTVLDTLLASDLKLFVDGEEVTKYVTDINIYMSKEDGRAVAGGYALINSGKVVVRSYIKAQAGSKFYEQYDTIDVQKIAADKMVLPTVAGYNVYDKIAISEIDFFDAQGRNINEFVEPAFSFQPIGAASVDANGNIVINKSGEVTIVADIYGDAKGQVSETINVEKYLNAEIKNTKENENFVVGDKLTPADFIFVNAENDTIEPMFTEIELSIDPTYADRAHMEDGVIVFDVAQDVKIIANANSEAVVAGQYEKLYRIGTMTIAEVIYPKYDYTVGDSIAIADLKLIDTKGVDVTNTYAKGAIKEDEFAFAPASAKVENGYIYLERPGKITITTVVEKKDSITYSALNNAVFADLLVADSIAFPEGPFTVGDKVLNSQFQVFAGERNITKYADINLVVAEADAHHVQDGIMLDKKGEVQIIVEVGGSNGVKAMVKRENIQVEPIVATEVKGMANEYTVFDKFDTKNLTVWAGERQINEYATVTVELSDNNIATKDEKGIITFNKAGEVDVTITISGNATSAEPFVKNITINAFADLEILFNGAKFSVADEIKASDFKVVYKGTKKEVLADYELAISCAEEGRTSGEGVLKFEKAGETTIDVEMLANEQLSVKKLNQVIDVQKLNIVKVIYPAGPYVVGGEINVANFQVIDDKNRDVTDYADDAFVGFTFSPEGNATFAEGIISFNKAGKVNVKAEIENSEIATSVVNDLWVIEQMVATSIELNQTVFTVGDKLDLTAVTVKDAEGKDITDIEDLFFFVEDGMHAEGTSIVFDAISVETVSVGIKGYNNVVKVKLTTDVTVNPIKAASIEGLEEEYVVFDQFDTKNLVVKDAEGNVINKYAELTVSLNNDNARLVDGIIYFDKAGEVNVTVKVGGNATRTPDFVLPVKINAYKNIEISFKDGKYYVADEVKLADFMIKDKATGKEINAEYALSISCDEARGTKVGNNIVLDKANETIITVKMADNKQLAIEDAQFKINVNKANPRVVVYPDGPYVVGGEINVADFMVIDTLGRNLHIKNYDKDAIMAISFVPGDMATFEAGKVTFNKAGKVNVVATVANDDIAQKNIETVWYIEQQVATGVTFQEGLYYVGDTLLLSEVKVFAGELDITENADPCFYYLDGAHRLDDGSIVLDKASEEYKFFISVKGYSNVENNKFPQTIQVLPRNAASVELPGLKYEVLDVMDLSQVIVKDAQGNNINNYAELSFSVDPTMATIEGNNLTFYKSTEALVLNVTVAGNATGGFAPEIEVVKNTRAVVTVPEDNFYVGDQVLLSQFDLEFNGKQFAAEYALSFDINEADGVKVDDNTIIVKNVNEVAITVTATGEVDIDPAIFTMHVKQCKANDVVWPNVDYVVGDSIAIDSLVVLDAINRDITEYVEYKGFVFEPSEAAYADMVKGYIYFKAPGTVKVATTVGGKLMEDATLFDKISIDQAEVMIVTLPKQQYTVADTLDIKDVQAFDKQGLPITIYADLAFSYDEEYAHAVPGEAGKIILDKVGVNTIDVVVGGLQGTAHKVLTPAMAVAPVAVAEVEIVGDYKVTDMIYTSAIKAYAANGVEITRYVATMSYQAADFFRAVGDDFMFISSGEKTINVVLGGENIAVAGAMPVVKEIAKVQLASIEFPEEPENSFRVDDVLLKSDFVLYDADGNDITEFAVISFTFTPAASAVMQGENIKLTATGNLTINVNVAGDVDPNTVNTSVTYFVRHNEDIEEGCYDLLVQVWEDLIIVDNNNEDLGLPKFVSYQWFMDEKPMAVNTQDFYFGQEQVGVHVYYAIAYDADGKSYLIKERTFEYGANKVSGRFMAYPTMLNATSEYTIESSAEGEVSISNAEGLAMDAFRVEAGKTAAFAPAATGVYIINFKAVDGQTATQKLIVK